MSGVAVIRHLLASHSPLTAEVPATRIMAGDLPLNTDLPAISVTQIDSMPRHTLAMTEGNPLHSDRVQVTVHVRTDEGGYPELRSLLALVLAACPNTRGTVNGVACDSVLPDVEGPDLEDAATNLLTGSRDFLVRRT